MLKYLKNKLLPREQGWSWKINPGWVTFEAQPLLNPSFYCFWSPGVCRGWRMKRVGESIPLLLRPLLDLNESQVQP